MAMERFKRLRDEFSDEIPDKVLSGSGDFKVRRNWWNGLVGNLDRGLKKGHIPEEHRAEAEAFIEHYGSDDFHRQPLTTEADIERANGLLDRILGRKQG